MIQCPHCFSWVTYSTRFCPCCECDLYPPRERSAEEASTQPIFGLKALVWGMILNILAAETTVTTVGFFVMALAALAFPAQISEYAMGVFLIPIWSVWGGICGIVGTLLCRHAKKRGNPSRVVRVAMGIGIVSMIVMAVLSVAAIVFFFYSPCIK